MNLGDVHIPRAWADITYPTGGSPVFYGSRSAFKIQDPLEDLGTFEESQILSESGI